MIDIPYHGFGVVEEEAGIGTVTGGGCCIVVNVGGAFGLGGSSGFTTRSAASGVTSGLTAASGQGSPSGCWS